MTTSNQTFPQSLPDEAGNAIETRDHEAIRQWAGRHQAEPARGEESPSGPATTNVQDGSVGIRFNFPGFARFRPITWEEWFDHFDGRGLTFVYEIEIHDRAEALWNGRGREDGHDQEDWLDAERQLRARPGGAPSARYRFATGATGGG